MNTGDIVKITFPNHPEYAFMVQQFVREIAKTIGFDVEVDGFEEMTALVLWKPYPYWHYAFFGGKKDPKT